MSEPRCWVCDTTESIVYTDVLGLHWCKKCYEDFYLAPIKRAKRQ